MFELENQDAFRALSLQDCMCARYFFRAQISDLEMILNLWSTKQFLAAMSFCVCENLNQQIQIVYDDI